MTDDERKKVALARLRSLLPMFGRKLDRDVRRLSPHDDDFRNVPTFAEIADEVARLLGPSAKA